MIDLSQLYGERARLDELPAYLDRARELAGEGNEVVLTGPGAHLAVSGRRPCPPRQGAPASIRFAGNGRSLYFRPHCPVKRPMGHEVTATPTIHLSAERATGNFWVDTGLVVLLERFGKGEYDATAGAWLAPEPAPSAQRQQGRVL